MITTAENETAENKTPKTDPSEETPAEEAVSGEENAEETAPEEPSQPEADPHEGQALSFGHYTDARIAEINERTLNTPGSGLFDVLAPFDFTAEKVREMILSYSFPETPYLGGEARTQETTDAILSNRALEALTDESFSVRYAVIWKNADLRSMPSMLEAKEEPTAHSFDLMQETGLLIGEGVLVLHESADGEFLFVQAPNYYGWIEEKRAAYCSEELFREFLTEEHFAVILSQRYEAFSRDLRLGTVLPYREKTDEGYNILLPVRAKTGELKLKENLLPYDAPASDGFLPYDAEDLVQRADSMTGFPYGWGDSDGGYDCSSFAGLLYRCYGFRLPRNSSQMQYFAGGTGYVQTLEGLSDTEKLSEIAAHPGAVLVMNRHVMVYKGTETAEDGTVQYMIVHSTSAYYDKADGSGYNEWYQTMKSDLLHTYRGDGSLFLTAIHTMLFFE